MFRMYAQLLTPHFGNSVGLLSGQHFNRSFLENTLVTYLMAFQRSFYCQGIVPNLLMQKAFMYTLNSIFIPSHTIR